MRVLYDANVWISAHHKVGSVCGKAIDAGTKYRLHPCVSQGILNEVAEVLAKKFKWSPMDIREAVSITRDSCELLLTPAPNVWPLLPDLKDGHVLDSVVFGDIDYVVTGDKKLAEYGAKTLSKSFMTPRQFLETFA